MTDYTNHKQISYSPTLTPKLFYFSAVCFTTPLGQGSLRPVLTQNLFLLGIATLRRVYRGSTEDLG
jgi:hypothetical protein